MYFAVPSGAEEAEKADPGSQLREAQPDHALHMWSQALFIISQLLTGGLLHINELDPIRRYLPSYNRPRKAGRYSAFQVPICISLGITKFYIYILYIII
jgi:hypothetical protein